MFFSNTNESKTANFISLHNQDITMCSWDLQSVDVIMSLMQNMDRKMQSLRVLLSALATTRILNPVFGLL